MSRTPTLALNTAFNVMMYIVESSGENLPGVQKHVNVRAFNYKTGSARIKYLLTSLCEHTVRWH